MIDSEREYYNIIVGGRSFINKQKKSWEIKYYYFESQVGSFFKPDPLSGGLGFGFAYFPHQRRYCPKLSSFAGAGLFLGFDYLFDHERTDLGIELVFPYPLEKKYRSIN